MMMSLAETSGSGGEAARLDPEELARVLAMQGEGNMDQEEAMDQELQMALRLSQEQPQVDDSASCCTLSSGCGARSVGGRRASASYSS